MRDVPNSSVKRCVTCHRSGGGSARNDFGFDYDQVGPSWSDLYELDSDHDGLSNGEELGDPQGEWSSSDPDPAGYRSQPGDPDDPAPEPGPDAGGAADGGSETVDGGQTTDPNPAVGCSCESLDNSTWMLLAGILILGITFGRRRGPRDRDR